MKPNRVLFAGFFFLFVTSIASGQVGIYAGFSGSHLSSSSGTTTLYGPLMGVYAQKGGFFSLGADVRGSLLSGNGAQFYSGALGPRIAFRPIALPIRPYVEALVGVVSYNSGSSSNAAHLNYQLLGGIDATILPRIDWRVIEFDYSAVGGNSVSARILTTGLVLRLP